jgi:HAD superfamily hydrolase (TIGR01509 family)
MEAVIFDLDGTVSPIPKNVRKTPANPNLPPKQLLDTEEVLDGCITDGCRQLLGVAPTAAQLASVRGFADEGPGSWPERILASVAPSAAGAPPPAALFAAVDALFLARAPHSRLLPGAGELVRALAAARVPLALCTSSMRRHYDLKRSQHQRDVFRHFEHSVVVEDAAPHPKPHPRPYALAAALLGTPPHRCVAVEDSVPGVTAAVAAGCWVVAVPAKGDEAAVRAAGAHLVLGSLAEWDWAAARVVGREVAFDGALPAAVRESCARVAWAAAHVAIDEAPLRALAARLAVGLAARPLPPWDEFGWHNCGPGAGAETVATAVLVINAMNWCFWPSGGAVEYEHLARGVAAAARAGGLTPAALTATRSADVLRWVPGLPDAEERAERVREVGRVLARDFCGSALNLIDSAGGSAAVLVRAVGAAFPGFRDEALHALPGAPPRQVFFYKRAQILVGDWWGALGRGPGGHAGAAFSDIGALTCFADYRLPQLLVAEGVLVYAEGLRERVAAREELPPGCAEEVEIRAATVEAVHRLRQVVKVLHGREVTSVELDWLLWNEGEAREKAGALPPHHRVRSIFY